MHAQRWDFSGPYSAPVYPNLPTTPTAVDEKIKYDAFGQRVMKELTVEGTTTYSAEIFSSLRLEGALFESTGSSTGDYQRDDTTEQVYASIGTTAIGRVVYDSSGDSTRPALPTIGGAKTHVFIEITDHLGSTSTVVDNVTGELVEHSTYQAYGAEESDYRPDRWSFWERYRFTGKQADGELGLAYFGARYYSPQLGRWMSPDPLAVHGFGADPNAYAYVRGRVLGSVDAVGLDDNYTPPSETTIDTDGTVRFPDDPLTGTPPSTATNEQAEAELANSIYNLPVANDPGPVAATGSDATGGALDFASRAVKEAGAFALGLAEGVVPFGTAAEHFIRPDAQINTDEGYRRAHAAGLILGGLSGISQGEGTVGAGGGFAFATAETGVGAGVGLAVAGVGVIQIVNGTVAVNLGLALLNKSTPSASTPVGGRGQKNSWPNPDSPKPRNAPTTIGGRDYSGHAIDRMQERGIPPSAVENAIQHGNATPGENPGTTNFADQVNNINVVTDTSTGRVITVW
jgi:RHS repeat-associated protein